MIFFVRSCPDGRIVLCIIEQLNMFNNNERKSIHIIHVISDRMYLMRLLGNNHLQDVSYGITHM